MQPPAPPAIPPALGAGWRRLHPLSPVVKLGGVAGALLFISLSSLGQSQSSRGSTGRNWALYLWVGLGALTLVGGAVSWLVTRWRVDGDDLQLEKGVLRRQSIRIPLTRIQAVDVVAPLTARILGLAEVRIVSAGRGAERARLAYVSSAEAPAVRAQLLALAHGLAPETPEPAAYPLLRVDNGRLVVALMTHGLAPLVVAAGLFVTVGTLASSRHTAAAASAVIPALITAMLPVARGFTQDYGFAVSAAGDGVRLDRGLLQTRHETIPFGRIQAVRLVEPLWWRLLGWARLDVDVARQHTPHQGEDPGAQQLARTLIPVGRREEVLWLLTRVLPGAIVEPPPGSQPPPRARLRAPLSYHFLALWLDQRHLCARTGRVQSTIVVVPFDKVQSVRLVSGPLQRRLRLATVHVDTAGRRWQARGSCRDQTEASGLLWYLADLARQARRPAVTPPPG